MTAFRPEWRVNRIAIDRGLPSRLFVATYDGARVSEDAGASWSRPGGDFPRSTVVDLALVKRTLYAGTDQGVWSMARTYRAAALQAESDWCMLDPISTCLSPLKFGETCSPS